MRYGVLGTGMVGQALATKLVSLGHEVIMGSRSADNKDARAWVETAGTLGRIGTFKDTAAFGKVLISCTSGTTSIDALRSCEVKDLEGKVLIDVSNPLDFSSGTMSLTICNTDSLGETLQREFPQLRVVKSLNTCNCQVMVNPGAVPGDHDIFVCGNDAKAKQQVSDLLREFGWKSIIDLGDITAARGTEQLMPLWMRLFGMYKSPLFNWKIARAG